MVTGVTMAGLFLGFATQAVSNGIRKLPLMRHPWEHVLAAGLGAVFTNSLVKWNAKLEVDLEKKLEAYKRCNRRRFMVNEDEDVSIGIQNWKPKL